MAMTRRTRTRKHNKNPHPLVHRATSAASAGPHLSCHVGRSRLSGGEGPQLDKKKNRQEREEHAQGEDIPGEEEEAEEEEEETEEEERGEGGKQREISP
jgi:hypothetical protein